MYKKFLWFLKDEFKGKLTRTNNDSEMSSAQHYQKPKKKTQDQTEYLIRYATEKMDG